MNCATHPNVAVAYCRTCGKPLCAICVRDVRGTVFCEQCLAERVGDALPPAPPPPPPGSVPPRPQVSERLPSPGLAAVLGFIPGVGAMYNGQFMKGFVHVAAFVVLIWMAGRAGPIIIPIFFAYFFYLVFDAYKTAHALELGQPLPDPFGFERMFGPTARPVAHNVAPAPAGGSTAATPLVPIAEAPPRKSVPTGAIVLIALGVLFLMHTAGLFSFGIERLLPLVLVGLGGWLLARRWGVFGPSGAACDCDRCKMSSIMWPAMLITFGMLILLDEFGISFGSTWPAILLVIGAVKLLQSHASDAGHLGGPPVPPPATPSPEPSAQGEPSSEVNHV